jgi:MoxR-like ATPase
VPLTSVEDVERALRDESYLPDRGLATAIYLALAMKRPLLLEGEAGVGKTEVAKTLSRILGAELIRLQCYEGLDASQALYEWDYARQLLYARALQEGHVDPKRHISELYGADFLLERPLLRAIRAGGSAVLLIDELDRADDEFDAFLLELLSDWQLTIPEVGTIRATRPPVVVITSNRTRELHDALKRRCLYHWIDYPTLEKELQIVATRLPGTPERLALQVCAFIQALRRHDLWKVPGVAETLDWTSALLALGVEELSQPEVPASLGCILKHQDDVQRVRSGLFNELLTEVTEASPIPAAPGVVVRDTPAR